MALLNPVQASVPSTVQTYASVGASDTFRPHERGVLLYRTGGTASSLTFVVPGNDDLAQPRPDPVVAFAATEARAIPTHAYLPHADPVTGLVTVTSSSQTAFTVHYTLT